MKSSNPPRRQSRARFQQEYGHDLCGEDLNGEPCKGEEKGRTSNCRGVDAGGAVSHAAAIASVQRCHASAPGEGFRAKAPRRGLLRRDAAIVSVGRHHAQHWNYLPTAHAWGGATTAK